MSYPTKKLVEVCEKIEIEKAPIETTPYIEIGDIDVETKTINYKEKRSVKGSIFPPPGCVIVSRVRPTRGAAALLNQRIAISSAFTILKPKQIIDLKFLFFYLARNSDFFYYLETKQKGSSYPSCKERDILDFEIPLPPLSEQKKIVSRLEKLLGKIKEAKLLRAEAEESVKNLLSAELYKIFSEGKKKGWQEKTLGKICDIARGGSPRPIKDYITQSDDGINWIKISDATNSTKYIYKTKEKIKKEGLKKTRLVKSGDFILSNSMSFGRPYIMKTSGAIQDGWLLLRPKESLMEEYMYYFLSSDDIYNQFTNLAGGAVVKNLNSDLVKSVKIYIPPLVEQKKIITRLDVLSKKIKKLQEYQKSTKDDLINLEQSILHKAFKGELIK